MPSTCSTAPATTRRCAPNRSPRSCTPCAPAIASRPRPAALAALAPNRDRHAYIGHGELGERGGASFLPAPALQGRPCVLETPGVKRSGASREEVELAKRLHKRGLAARKRAKSAS